MVRSNEAVKRSGTVRKLVDKVRATLSSGSTSPFGIHDGRPLLAPLPPVAEFRDAQAWVQLPESFTAEELALAIERDVHALPQPEDREGYHGERHYDYWRSGLVDLLRIRAALERHAGGLAPDAALLDLGCASGRVLRHFLHNGPELDLWGADINSRHVEWVRRHLESPRLKLVRNSILPALPIPDASLDLVYAFSVLTHIDEFELAWIAELRRMLKPGGLAYVTIHSEHTWAALNPEWSLWQGLVGRRKHIRDHNVTPELFDTPMPEQRVVFQERKGGNYTCNVFHHTDYVRDTWGRFLEVLEFVPQGADYQDVVVLRRR